ncbi:hypothetical protein OUZ56_000536 [Daphnia magna]|uniref:Uncharacterized protein n=1 Tax=Daphnia magna TaxID=35525 RepID=A0ABQ9ZZZ1_9CRUS|nr:hypothetical protein OUZ56_000536 [Daphnia magna]
MVKSKIIHGALVSRSAIAPWMPGGVDVVIMLNQFDQTQLSMSLSSIKLIVAINFLRYLSVNKINTM